MVIRSTRMAKKNIDQIDAYYEDEVAEEERLSTNSLNMSAGKRGW